MQGAHQVPTSGIAYDPSSYSSYHTAPASFPSWSGPDGIWGSVIDLSRVIDEAELKRLRRIGRGGYAEVYKLDHSFFGNIALKRIHEAGDDNICTEERRRAREEGILWQRLQHLNILKFFGIFESNIHYFLISEYAPNGTISTYTKAHPGVDRVELLAQAADGLAYLHEKHIVHGDVKGANVLISGDVRALVCDFGLAKTFESITSSHRHGAGSTRWMSPEVLDGKGRTPESDVWSFGMMTAEVLSGDVPYAGISPDTRVILAILHDNARPPKSPLASEGGAPYHPAWLFAEACWHEDPSQRPKANLARMSFRPAGILCQLESMIMSIAFSPNSPILASVSGDNAIRLWDVVQGISLGQPLYGQTNCVVFSRDGTILVSASDDCTLRLWDVSTGRMIGEPLRGHTERIRSVTFSPDGRTIASGSEDKTIRIWDSVSRSCIAILEEHAMAVMSVAFSSDGKTLVSGSFGAIVRRWDMATYDEIEKPMWGHRNSVRSVAVSPDGSTIASGSYDKTIRLWDAQSGEPKGPPLKGHTSVVSSVAFHPNGRLLASGSEDNTIRIWDLTTASLTTKLVLQDHTDCVRSVACSSDGKWLASGSDDRTVRLWDLEVLLGIA